MMYHESDVVRDVRRPPFCYQTLSSLTAIRSGFTGARLATALGIYVTLTEVANRAGGAAARDGFTAARGEIADACGVSVDTLDRYCRELVTLGLLSVEKQKIGAVNLPNRWVLDEPEEGAPAPPSRTPAARGSRTGAAPRARSSVEPKKTIEEKTVGGEGFPLPPPLHKIDGRNVGFDTLCAVCGISPSDPNRGGEVAAALNGGKTTKVGVRALCWKELIENRGEEVAALNERGPERFERALAAMIVRRAAQYRQAMPGATLTPPALAKWWLSLERAAPAGGMTADEIRAYRA